MKKYFIYAVSALALAGCSSDDFLGGQPSPTKLTDNNVINFNGGSSATTRATKTKEHGDAATALGKNFVVYGYKTSGSPATPSVVYDHYNVNWAGTANHTESNTAGWEYVGQTPNMLSKVTVQTIKYWDYSADRYDFIAFSLGADGNGNRELTQIKDGTPTSGNVLVSEISNTPEYTLTGAVEDLAKVYIADRVTAMANPTIGTKPNLLSKYGDPIQFNFRSLGTKVRIGLYETIPGYSVKDVKFYKNGSEKNDNNGANPCLYASSATIPSGIGTMTVTFGTSATDLNKAHVAWGSNDLKVSVLTVGNFPTGIKEKNEDEGTQGSVKYLVRNSTDARGENSTVNPYTTVLPAPVGNLNLKVDYTLVSIDGSKETINVTGATAVVPAEYTNWQPNYAYTYIFKISDKTNGSTGDGSPAGLYPITFDAIVTETENGLSETITTVSEPSITTYAKDSVGNEYKANSNVYVSVMKANVMASLAANGANANCALYTATVEEGAVQDITEATVANCLANGKQDPSGTWTATDANGKKLVVTKADGLAATNTIEATDAPDGNAVVVNDENGNNKNVFAKFTPSAGTYVFQYIEGGNKYYKVIKVVD